MGAGGRLSASSGDGGKAVAALTGVAAGAAEGGADGSDTLAGLGYGGAGGGSVLVFARAFAVDAGGRVAADGGAGAGWVRRRGQGRGGGGGRVHLEWARDGAAARTPPPRGGGPDRAGRDRHRRRRRRRRGRARNSERLRRSRRRRRRRRAERRARSRRRARLGSRACCARRARDVQGGHGQRRCSPRPSPGARCLWIRPRRPGRRRRRHQRLSVRVRRGRRAPVFPACATRAGGGGGGGRPRRRGRGARTGCSARAPLAAVVGRARAGAALGRRRARHHSSSGFFPTVRADARVRRRRVASRARRVRERISRLGSGDAVPAAFARLAARGGSGSGSTADGSAARRRASRARFSGCTSPARAAFGDPWRLPAPRCNRCTRRNGPDSCARARRARRELGRRPEARAALGSPRPRVPRPGDPDETARGGSAVRRRVAGAMARRGGRDHGALFAPGQTWWRGASRRVTGVPGHAAGRLRRRCLRSARARAAGGARLRVLGPTRASPGSTFRAGRRGGRLPSFPTSREASAEVLTARGEGRGGVSSIGGAHRAPAPGCRVLGRRRSSAVAVGTAPGAAADEGCRGGAPPRRAAGDARRRGEGGRARRCGGATAWSASRRRTLSCHRAAPPREAPPRARRGGARLRLRRRRRSRPAFPGPGRRARRASSDRACSRAWTAARSRASGDVRERSCARAEWRWRSPRAPEDDPFGGFSLGLLGVSAEALFDVPEEDGAFFARPDLGDLGPNDARLTGNATNSDEDVSSDAERAPFLVRAEETSQGLETLETQPGSFVETAVRGAAAWAMAAATSTSPARAESDHFQSLRSLAAPRAQDGRGAPGLTSRAKTFKVFKVFKVFEGNAGTGTHDANDGIGQRNGGRNASARAGRRRRRRRARRSPPRRSGTVLYAPRAAGAFGDTIERKERRRITLERGLIRTWFRLASMPRLRRARRGARRRRSVRRRSSPRTRRRRSPCWRRPWRRRGARLA